MIVSFFTKDDSMQDVLEHLSQLRRPRLLIRAARSGTIDYVRNQHLRRVLGSNTTPYDSTVIRRLIALENRLNQKRKHELKSYSIVAHVDLLIAILAEAQLLRASNQI